MSPTLTIKLLGGFSLTYGDRPTVISITGRSQLLLAYLLLHRHTPQSRQRIAFHLWPESTDTQARTNLRKELSSLRRALPQADELLRLDTQTLQWLPTIPITVDIAEFETTIKASEQTTDLNALRIKLEYAIDWYRGDLLPDRDEEWVLPERERLRQMQKRVLERLIQLLEQQNEVATALTYAQKLLRIDPLNETSYGTLMRLHGLNGDRANVLQIYHQCMAVLREELGVDPSGATRKLYEQWLMDDAMEDMGASPASPNPQSPPLPPRPSLPLSSPASAYSSPLYPLVGRESEWNSIQQWASTLLQGERASGIDSKVLLLVGEPGIGKTRLLEELRAMAQAHQVQILWGHGFAAEMTRPYGIWIDALRTSAIASVVSLPSNLGFLLPELGHPFQPPTDLSHLLDAVVQLLQQGASQAPVFILLDDMQWFDEASSALLHYAMRVLRPLPVLFACTARAGELDDNAGIMRVLQTLRREQRLQILELSPLNQDQTADLIRFTHGLDASDLSSTLVNQVFVDSGGNPLFALEIARAIAQHQSSHVDAVETLIHERLQHLDDTAREVLEWAAALGRSFQPSTITQVADYSMTRLLTAIAQLEQQAIIRPGEVLETELGYDFAHDIVRQAVYQHISEPRRQMVHRQIARKLYELGTADQGLASTIAHHACLGGDRTLATSAALSAAERCLKLFAYTEALELAQQGIQHCQFLDPPNRVLSHVRFLRVCATTGITGAQAVDLENEIYALIQEAKPLGLTNAEAIALETLLILNFDQNNFTEVHHHSLRIAEASRFASPATAARMLAYSGSCLAEIGRDMIRAEALLLESQALAARTGCESGDIFAGLGCIHRHQGRYDEARSLLQQAWHFTQTEQDHWRECTYLSYLIMIELDAGNPIAALPYCREMASVAAQMQGDDSQRAIAKALEALAHYQLHQPDAVITLAEAIAHLQQVDAKRMLAYVLSGAAAVDLHSGSREGGGDRLELAVNRAKWALRNAHFVNHPSEIALSWAILIQGLWALGDYTQATAQFEALRPSLDRHALSLAAQTAVERVIHLMPTLEKSTQYA